MTLAAATQGVGVYMEDPPYDEWFNMPDAGRDRAASCDLNFMVRLGLTSVSPSLVTPDGEHLTRFANQMALVRDAGFTGPVLAYAPMKRLIAGVGIDGIGGPMSLLGTLLHKRGEAGPALVDRRRAGQSRAPCRRTWNTSVAICEAFYLMPKSRAI